MAHTKVGLGRAASSNLSFFELQPPAEPQHISPVRILKTQSPVVCLRFQLPVRSITSNNNGAWLIEYADRRTVSVIADGLAKNIQVDKEIQNMWWIDKERIGMLFGDMRATMIDIEDKKAWRQKNWCVEELETITLVGAIGKCRKIIAWGQYVVTVVGKRQMWLWDVTQTKDNRVEAKSEELEEDVVDVRWTNQPHVCVAVVAARDQPQTGRLVWVDVAKSAVAMSDWRLPLSLVVGSWRWQHSVIAINDNTAMVCMPSPTGANFHIPNRVLHNIEFEKGWVWLCGSLELFVLLAACKRKIQICGMPKGECVCTVDVVRGNIQEVWIEERTVVVVAGDMAYLIDVPKPMKLAISK